MTLAKHIFLIGFMGSGKSTVSEALREKTGAEVIDTDARIVENEGMAINEIFAQKGEAYFRDLETSLLETLAKEAPQIVSCGGGMILREGNVALMKASGVIVLLSATPETILERVKDNDDRPLLRGHMNIPDITELMEARKPRYLAAADKTVTVDGKAPSAIAEEILALL